MDRVRRALLFVAWTALLCTALVAVTGGFTFRVIGFRVSSESLLNPLLFTVAAAAAWMLSARGRYALLVQDVRGFAAPCVACAIAAAVVTTGFQYGALVAGGSDSYGYVSQAEAWAAGTLRFDEPLIREFAGPEDPDALCRSGISP